MTNRTGLYAGLALTLLTVATLLALHLSSPTTPRVHDGWETPPDVILCLGAPEWVAQELPVVLEELKTHGIVFGEVREESCPTCATDQDRSVACVPGAISIDLMDQWFDDTHAGETLIQATDLGYGAPLWASIQLPSAVVDSPVKDEELPPGVESLVLAHELVHALGYGHTETRIFGPFIGRQTGNLMNPYASKLGWNTTGLE